MVKEFILKVLDFCNVLDYAGKLSITNIALIALVGKMVIAPTLDWPSVVTVITVFSNYMHKRSVASGSDVKEE